MLVYPSAIDQGLEVTLFVLFIRNSCPHSHYSQLRCVWILRAAYCVFRGQAAWQKPSIFIATERHGVKEVARQTLSWRSVKLFKLPQTSATQPP